MKIITWNACCKFREKYSLLSQYDADILVIQECEDPSRSLCQAYRAFSGQYVWVGANKKVHLGSPWNAALTFKKKYRSSRKP